MLNKTEFKKAFLKEMKQKYGVTDVKTATPQQLHDVLGNVVMTAVRGTWDGSTAAHLAKRRACYFSMEFLMGRLVFNNLLCLGIYDEVEAAFKSLGLSLSDLEEIEDAALGNGGLGRLAACFLDSAATLNLPLDGYGIRYKYGLFKQGFRDGFQTEKPDDWARYGDPWSVRREEDIVTVAFSDRGVKAVPYDMPVAGYGTENVGTLRLWQAEAVNEFDFDLFNSQKYLEASSEKTLAEDISKVLYPNDDTNEGKKLRLKQQYFFCAASLADIIKKHKQNFGSIESIADYVSIQLNDTHPVISIPEFIRLLIDGEGLDFETAFGLALNVFNYTNHTVMPEALEKWDCGLIEELLPRVFEIIIMLNERLICGMYDRELKKDDVENMKIIIGTQVHMANMAVYCSAHTNGVAQIHTEIIKGGVLKRWYAVYPERFQNKTNGITQRRWFMLCNRELSGFVTELLGGSEWAVRLDELKKLKVYAENNDVIGRFIDIKTEKKKQLAAHILKAEGVILNPGSIFDIQIKRLHEYKRQLMNAFSILYIYFGIKDGTIKDFTPTTFIFGAKSAPGYRRAKGIIKYINEIGRIVDGDPDTKELLKVLFVTNYNVSYAEKLVAAADVSEQISTAGTEASGTGNMKLMLNGAVTLGTYDGANIEIAEEAGEANNYIFGATTEELETLAKTYDTRAIIAENGKIRRVIQTLIDGTFSDGGTGVFRELYYSLLDGAHWHKPDNYFILADLESYVEAKLQVNRDYTSREEFAKKCWLNMCSAGKFSSDRTIKDYAKNIWKIES